jgi:hypothetical protein
MLPTQKWMGSPVPKLRVPDVFASSLNVPAAVFPTKLVVVLSQVDGFDGELHTRRLVLLSSKCAVALTNSDVDMTTHAIEAQATCARQRHTIGCSPFCE